MALVPAAAPAAVPPVTGAGPLFGLADNRLAFDTPSEMDSALDQDVSLGVTAVREQLSWAAAEPQPGRFDWSRFDGIVQAVTDHHLSLLAVVDFTPSWARAVGCLSWRCPPADPRAFASFVAAAASRYGSHVAAWEIWNEPNSAAFWEPRPDAGAYSRLLAGAAAAIRSVDSRAVIVSGGLAPGGDQSNVDPRSFLSAMCSDGALATVDAVGVHPYSYPVPPDYPASWNAWQQMADTAFNERGIMAACGQASKPIWVTEYGAPTGGPGPEATTGNYDLRAHPDHVSEALQAEMVQQAVTDARSYPWMGAVFFYTAQDRSAVGLSNQDFFGLRRYDGTPKPAWAELHSELTGSG